jgi:hypothetical protein
MRQNRSLMWAIYGLAAFMIFVPPLEVVAGVLPLRFSEVGWRFGAMGLASRAIMTPLLGLLLVSGTALWHEHRLVLYGVSVMSALLSVGLGIAGGLFVLDAVQMRAGVQAEIARTFDAASVLALTKLVVSSVVTMALAIGAWGACRAATDVKATPRIVLGPIKSS